MEGFSVNKRRQNYLIIALVVTLVTHFTILFMNIDTKKALKLVKQDKPKEEKRIKIRFATKKNKKKKQIVTTEKTNIQKKNDSNLLSEKNNFVKKQTKAKNIDSFHKAGKGNNKHITQKAQKRVLEKSKNVKKVAKKIKKNKGNISFKDLSFSSKVPVLAKKNLIKGQKNGDTKTRGVAKNNDYLEEVPLGDMTNLNTQEFKYYGFYFRIKQQLEQYWGASIREKIERVYKRNDGRFPASDKYLTSVRVVLDGKGKIIDVLVRDSSGISELDEAAIESFNKAGPFPNPPKGMLRNDRAAIEWGFAVTNS